MTTRRNFLIGASQIGVVAAMAPKLVFASQLQQKPIRILSTGLAGEREFHSALMERLTHGGQTDISVVGFDPGIWKSPGRLSRELAALSGVRLVGFADPKLEMILMQHLMDRSAPVFVRGDHAIDSAGVSRHDFLSTPSSAGIGGALSESLAKAGAPYSISVRELGAISASAPVGSKKKEVATQWTTALGLYYADIAMGRWQVRNDSASYGSGSLMAERLDRVASTFIADI